MNADVDLRAVTGQAFVNGVVDDFEDAVVQTAFGGVPDVHVRSLADTFEAFEFLDLGGVVDFFFSRVAFWVFRQWFVAH